MARPVADWKKAGEYPEIGARLSPKRWAWEFLRRNPAYQDEREALFQHRRQHREQTQLDLQFARRWHLAETSPYLAPDPFADPAKVLRFVRFEKTPEAFSPPIWHPVTPDINAPERVFLVDVRLPIDGQIEAIKRAALHYQNQLVEKGVIDAPQEINVRANEWPIYLRLLDAELAGVTDTKKIAAVIYPGQHTGKDADIESLYRLVRKNRKLARKFRDPDYRWIAAINPKRNNSAR